MKPEMLQSVRCYGYKLAKPAWTTKLCTYKAVGCTVENLQCRLYSELLNLQLRASSRVSITIGRRPSPALEHAIEGDNLTHH